MAKTGIKKIEPQSMALQKPDWLVDQPVEGLEELKQYVRPPFLKVVQKAAGEDLLSKFSKGDLILVPQNLLVAAYNDGNPEHFTFVPIFFYPEFCVRSPIELKGQVPFILDRSLDPRSEIAHRCKSPELRTQERYQFNGHTMTVTYVEHLNFVVFMPDHPMFSEEAMILSFTKAEWKTGARLSSLIKMRKASVFDCVFEANVCTTPRQNAKGSWHGLDIDNPGDVPPWVSREQHETYRAMHLEFKALHQKGLLRVDYDPDQPESDDAETEEASEF